MTRPAIQMTPGDDIHLTLLMAPFSLNFFTGQDRQHLLAFGRAAFEAGRAAAPQAVQAAEEMRVCNNEECSWIGPLDALAIVEKLPRYTYGYKSDEWGMNRSLTTYQDGTGQFLLRSEVIAALADQAKQGEQTNG